MKLHFLPLAFAGLASASQQQQQQLRRQALATPEDLEYLAQFEDDKMMLNGTMANVTIVDVASIDYHSLYMALQATGLDQALATEGPFTLFAPDDQAFDKLGNQTLAKLFDPQWRTHLADILSYHVVMGEQLMAEDLMRGDVLEMGNGETANITAGAPRTSINGHAISHADNVADNGVVHAIGSVLLPGWVGTNVVDAAASLPDIFGTLSTAIAAAGFDGILNEKGPFTVFAPTNEAFAKMDNATLEWALGPNGTNYLFDLLAYHVYPGIVTMEDIADIVETGKLFTMSNGFYAELNVTTAEYMDMIEANMTAMMNETAMTMNETDMDGIDVVASAFEAPALEYTINDILITSGDILVDNGIIHIIDEVNIPPFVRK